MSKHESNRLYNRHQSEYNSYRAAGAGSQLADKVGIRHIVNVCHQHADSRWNPQGNHKPGDWRLCHFKILF